MKNSELTFPSKTISYQNHPLAPQPTTGLSQMQDIPAPTALPLNATQAPVHQALSLTKGGTVAHIALEGQLYVLRITKGGKLILTK